MRGRALIIATSRYSDPQLSELRSTLIDAAGLKQVLSDPRRGDFAVTTSVDSTSQELQERIGDFFLDAGREELLLLYISGHGVKDKAGRLYFAAANTTCRRLLQTGVPASFIHEAARQSRSDRVLIMLDTCFSGAFAKGTQTMSGATVNAGQYFCEGTGRVVITACDAIQYALVDDTITARAPGSFFSRHVIKGLLSGDADIDGDGQITTEELFHYISKGIGADTEAQQPQRWAFGVKGDFVVASNPVPRAGKLPEEIVVLMQTPKLRLLAVEKLEALLLSTTSRPMVLAAEAALEELKKDSSKPVSGAADAVLQKVPRTALGAAPVSSPMPRPPVDEPPAPPSERPQAGDGSPRARPASALRSSTRPPAGSLVRWTIVLCLLLVAAYLLSRYGQPHTAEHLVSVRSQSNPASANGQQSMLHPGPPPVVRAHGSGPLATRSATSPVTDVKGWAIVGDGAIFATTDGRAWARQDVPADAAFSLASVYIADDGIHGWVVRNGRAC